MASNNPSMDPLRHPKPNPGHAAGHALAPRNGHEGPPNGYYSMPEYHHPEPRSPYEQHGGPPGPGQPYAAPQPEHPVHSPGAAPNRYSYDSHLRYAPDPNHDPNQQQYIQEAPRQYGPPMGQGLPLPSLSTMTMPGPNQGYGPPQEMAADTTGQIAPPGMKPKVTATLWEDEGTLCFQVDVNGTCVARREDNHMINGTKLLNVAGMTRGRRDGILKAEKQKHVVKIGPMHLKGVWIPYERALEFANKEKITPLLYPLFVHNIGALLYHPTNHARGPAAWHIPRRGQDESAVPTSPPGPGPNGGAVLFNSREDARVVGGYS